MVNLIPYGSPSSEANSQLRIRHFYTRPPDRLMKQINPVDTLIPHFIIRTILIFSLIYGYVLWVFPSSLPTTHLYTFFFLPRAC